MADFEHLGVDAGSTTSRSSATLWSPLQPFSARRCHLLPQGVSRGSWSWRSSSSCSSTSRRRAPGELRDRRPRSGLHCCCSRQAVADFKFPWSAFSCLVCGSLRALLWSPLLCSGTRTTASLCSGHHCLPLGTSSYPSCCPVGVLVLVLYIDSEAVINASQHFLKMLFHVLRAQRRLRCLAVLPRPPFSLFIHRLMPWMFLTSV